MTSTKTRCIFCDGQGDRTRATTVVQPHPYLLDHSAHVWHERCKLQLICPQHNTHTKASATTLAWHVRYVSWWYAKWIKIRSKVYRQIWSSHKSNDIGHVLTEFSYINFGWVHFGCQENAHRYDCAKYRWHRWLSIDNIRASNMPRRHHTKLFDTWEFVFDGSSKFDVCNSVTHPNR